MWQIVANCIKMWRILIKHGGTVQPIAMTDMQDAIDAQIEMSPQYLKSIALQLDMNGVDPNLAYDFVNSDKEEARELGREHGLEDYQVDQILKTAYDEAAEEFYS